MLTTLVSFALVLGVLVFFHELGHYWVARRNGIVVEEFGMGYPPRMIKLFRYDGTDFTLNWLPFGGFARMKGEDAADMSRGSFNAASRWGRAATLFAGPLMNLLLAIILFAISFMYGGSDTAAAYPQIINSAQAEASKLGLQEGDILLSAGDKPLFVSAIGDEGMLWQPATADPLTVDVLRNDKTVRIENAKAAELRALLASKAIAPVLTIRIEEIASQSPAEVAGIKPGDLVYGVNGELVSFDNPLNTLVNKNLDKEMTITLVRDQQMLNLKLIPRSNPPEGEGAMGVKIGLQAAYAKLPLLASLRQGVLSTFQYITLVLQLPMLLLMGEIAPSAAQVSGPIGIAREVGSTVSYTIDSGIFWPIWRLSAVLSAALAITNLLPLPALDGGRLLFILIETLRGRRVNPEREGFVHMIGFLVLLSLMVLVTIRDIVNPSETINWSQILGQ